MGRTWHGLPRCCGRFVRRPEALAAVERGRRARRLGRRGERIARRALRRTGYRIVARNLRTPHGEVDLLAREGERLVVVEVKTTARRDADLLAPAVPERQRRRLRRAAAWLAVRAGARRPLRRDLVIVALRPPPPRVRIRRGHF